MGFSGELELPAFGETTFGDDHVSQMDLDEGLFFIWRGDLLGLTQLLNQGVH